MKLETDRLVLRSPRRSDVDGIYRLAKNPRVLRGLLLPSPYERKDAEQFVRLAANEARRGIGTHLVVERREGRIVVGTVGLCNVRPHHRRAELGYWLGAPFWGRGFGTEAATALLDHAFRREKLHRVCAYTIAGNERSEALLERLGFVKEGVRREDIKQRGRYRDLSTWGLLAAEWSAARRR